MHVWAGIAAAAGLAELDLPGHTTDITGRATPATRHYATPTRTGCHGSSRRAIRCRPSTRRETMAAIRSLDLV